MLVELWSNLFSAIPLHTNRSANFGYNRYPSGSYESYLSRGAPWYEPQWYHRAKDYFLPAPKRHRWAALPAPNQDYLDGSYARQHASSHMPSRLRWYDNYIPGATGFLFGAANLAQRAGRILHHRGPF